MIVPLYNSEMFCASSTSDPVSDETNSSESDDSTLPDGSGTRGGTATRLRVPKTLRVSAPSFSSFRQVPQINSGLSDFQLRQEDLVVQQHYHSAQMSTVLMIDISHSMILYGEDRITPAKKVALALSELILTRYHKDTQDLSLKHI